MSFTGGMFGTGASTGAAMRYSQTRGRIQGGMGGGVNYPNPFFDVAHTYLPQTIKHLFKFCAYYFFTQPLVNATAFKLSEYPITDIIIDHDDPGVRKKWREYFHDHLQYRNFQIECGLDYHVYGNCIVSISFPFQKYLKCKECGWTERAEKTKPLWTFTNYEYRLNCPQCGSTSEATAYDHYVRNASGIKLIRWSVEDVEITYNEMTGESTYFYTIPGPLRNDITVGKKDVVDKIPQIFIQALRQGKGVVLSKDNLFHLKRPTLAWKDRGWGVPLLLPVLKDTFHLQMMKKATEAVLLEHVVPLRAVFPQAASGSTDPFCVSPGTLVETLGGLLPAEEIQEGDYLRSHTGAWRRVEALKRRQVGCNEKVYKLKVASLAAFPFTVSEDHPILAVPRVGGRKKPRLGLVDPAFIPTQELKKGDYVAYPVKRTTRGGQELDLANYIKERSVTENWVYRRLNQGAAEVYEWLEDHRDHKFAWGERKVFLEEHGWREDDFATAHAMRVEGGVDRVQRYMTASPALAQLIGYYLAEGSRKDSLVSFSLHLKETDIAEKIEYIVKGLGFRGVSHHERPAQNGREAVIEDVLLSEFLINMCGEGFAGKRIPDVVSEGSDDEVLCMLRALFAGDGCDFRTSTNRVGLKLSNPSIILEARRLFLSFGLIGGTIKEEPTETSKFRTTAYQLNFNGAAAEKVRELFGGEKYPFDTVPQKSGLFRGDYVLLRIDEIEEAAVDEVIGFQMNGDKSFCVAGVATHNTTINLVDWRDQVASEISRWRFDNNYIPIMPLPLGQQTIGGEGKNLLLYNEMQALSDHIIMGMGVPKEFLAGGLSYAGTNVSMRMLENAFIGYVSRHRLMARWVMRFIANFMRWPEVNVRFKPFKMADDLQRKAYLFQLRGAKEISSTTLLADADLDREDEDQIMERESARQLQLQKKEQLAQAEIQGEAQVIMQKMQVKAQQAMQVSQTAPQAPGEPGGPADGTMPAQPPDPAQAQGQLAPQEAQSPLSSGARLQPGQAGMDITQMAQGYAQQIAKMPPDQQQQAVQALMAQSPELGQLVQQLLSAMGGQQQAQGPAVDTRPLPDKLPPRRTNSPI
jgi:intein/homing endonuclease